MKNKHGEIVERAIRNSSISISEIANRMQVTRRTLYYWFKQDDLPSHVISQLGDIINYDFSLDLNGFIVHDDDLSDDFTLTQVRTPSAQKNSVHYWMTKYLLLLEKYNELLSKKI